jgi:3-oxoadipate enol-lactonase
MQTVPLAHQRWDGGGALLLLLHGIGGGRHAWGDAKAGIGPPPGRSQGGPAPSGGSERGGIGAALRDAGFDVMALDLPGYGASPLVDPLTIGAMARAALACIDWAGDERAIVLGHSMGGMVAQEMAVLAPQRIAALVLSGTSAAFGKPGGDWQQRFLAERLKPLNDGLGMARLASQLVPAMCAPHAPAAAIATATRVMAAVPEPTYRAALRALMGFDRRDNLERLKMPVLLLAGELDPNAPPPVMQGMAQRIEGADYRCLPGVGHLANIEAPQPFVDAVVTFLRARLQP